jgi:lipoprotein NlpD
MSRKGIDIAGRKGDKVYAAQSGIVAYAGSGLANYGNLIIIKHPNNYLTAYGNNARNLVKEGQYVNSGQVIAEMGIINHQYYGLHFEIRQQGKPLNPLLFLRR